MSKSKKTPEQEEETKGKATAAPEEDPKPAEETPKDGKPEEKPAAETPEDKGNPEEKPSEEKPEDAEDPKKDEEKPAEEEPEDEEQPKDDPAKDPAPAATGSEGSEREAQLEAELLEARGQLAAYPPSLPSTSVPSTKRKPNVHISPKAARKTPLPGLFRGGVLFYSVEHCRHCHFECLWVVFVAFLLCVIVILCICATRICDTIV